MLARQVGGTPHMCSALFTFVRVHKWTGAEVALKPLWLDFVTGNGSVEIRQASLALFYIKDYITQQDKTEEKKRIYCMIVYYI